MTNISRYSRKALAAALLAGLSVAGCIQEWVAAHNGQPSWAASLLNRCGVASDPATIFPNVALMACGLAAAIMGALACRQINREKALRGKGLAIVAIALGCLATLAAGLLAICFISQ